MSNGVKSSVCGLAWHTTGQLDLWYAKTAGPVEKMQVQHFLKITYWEIM